MRRVYVLIALCMSVINSVESYESKIWKFFSLGDSKSIMISDDYEVFELNHLTPNKQTWSEWFYGNDPEQVPSEYLLQNKMWEEGTIINVLDYPWITSEEAKLYRNNTHFLSLTKDYLSLCTLVLEDYVTGEKVFARKIDIQDWAEIYLEFEKAKNILVEHLHPGSKKYLNDSEKLLLFGMKILMAKHYLLKSYSGEERKYYEGETQDQKYIEFDEIFHFTDVRIILSKMNV